MVNSFEEIKTPGLCLVRKIGNCGATVLTKQSIIIPFRSSIQAIIDCDFTAVSPNHVLSRYHSGRLGDAPGFKKTRMLSKRSQSRNITKKK